VNRHRLVNVLAGAAIVLVGLGFVLIAYTAPNVQELRGYELIARFDRADGIARGSLVRLAGIRIGSVVEQRLDPASFRVMMRLSIDPSVTIPADSAASIASEGLMGTAFVAISPGGDDRVLAPGSEITRTQSSVDFIALLAKVLYGSLEEAARKTHAGSESK